MALPPVLLLDLDDTILDDTGTRGACWERACDEIARRHSLDGVALLREIEAVRDWFWADAERHRIWRADMRRAWCEVAGIALRRIGVADPEPARELGERHFELRDEAIAPLPQALESLDELRGRGVTLGLVTNGGSEGQRAKIERFALAAHFAYIGIEGEVGFGKPDARAFERALSHLDAAPEDTWMVGDNLAWDVAGAQAAGILGIWLDRDGAGLPAGSPAVPDRIVRSVAELL